jgi:transcription elongation factor Elf1
VLGCSQKFMTHNQLSEHIRGHNTKSKDPPTSASKVVPKIPVTCASCGAEFGSREVLQHHISVAHLPKYPCPSCNQIFSSSGALDEHRSTSHLLFSCANCSQKFTSSETLLAHGRREHSGSSSDASTRKTAASQHQAPSVPSHTVPKVQPCSICTQSFASIDELSSHIRTIHPLKKIYPCPSCDRSFSEMDKLSAHKTAAHYPVCAICRLKYPSQQALDDHVTAVHQTCAECNIGFEDNAAYATASFSLTSFIAVPSILYF